MAFRLSLAHLALLGTALLVLLSTGVDATCNATNTTAPAPAGPPQMSWKAWVTVVIVACVLTVLMLDLVGCTCAMVFSSVLLWLTTVISLDDIFVGMTNGGVLAIVAMFIIVHPLAELPLMQTMVKLALSGADCSPRWPLFKICFLSMALSSFIENIPQVAMFTPIIKELCREMDLAPSQFLLPMDYSTLIGNWMIIGSSNNLVISGLMEDYGLGPMPFFELGKVGGLSSVPSLFYLVFFPALLLPTNKGGMFKFVKEHGHSFLMQIRIRTDSVLVGAQAFSLAEHMPEIDDGSVEVLEIIHQGHKVKPTGAETLEAGDVLVLSGAVSTIISSLQPLGLEYYFESDLQMRKAAPPEGSQQAAADHEMGETAGGDASGTPNDQGDAPPPAAENGDGTATNNEPVASGSGAGTPKSPKDNNDASITSQRQSQTSDVNNNSVVVTNEPYDDDDDTHFRRNDSFLGTHTDNESLYGDAAIPVPARNVSFSRKNAAFVEENKLYEVVLSHDCPLLNTTLATGNFQYRYSTTILALRTSKGAGDMTGGDMMDHLLDAGDTLLVLAPKNFPDEWRPKFDFLMINEFKSQKDKVLKDYYFTLPACCCLGHPLNKTEGSKRILRIPHWYKYLSVVAFLGVVIAAILHVKLHAAALLAVCFLVMVGIMDTKTAIGYIDWNSYLMVAFSFGLGKAVDKSGLASVIGYQIVEAGITGFWLLLLIGCLTSLLANVVTNKAAAQVMFPIVFRVYETAGNDPLPGIMVLAACSVMAFSTPYGYATNVLVMGPGGYSPVDFLKFGIPLNIMIAIVIPTTAALFYGTW